jgi:hypothetical protein
MVTTQFPNSAVLYRMFFIRCAKFKLLLYELIGLKLLY